MGKQPKNPRNIFSKESMLMLIISTILAFIVGKFLDPLFTYCYSLLINTGGAIIKQLSDSTYKQISNGYSEQPSFFILYIVILLASALFANFFSSIKQSYTLEKEKYNTYKKALNIINTPIDEDSPQLVIPSSDTEPALQKDAKTLEKEVITIFNRIKKEFFIITFMMFLLYGYIFFSYSRNLYINSKITSITNNIEIVSPYITDVEYKRLKSQFHTMENSDDYDSLNFLLSDIAEKNSVKLKK